MSFIAHVEAEVAEHNHDQRVEVEYGEVREDFSTLEELLEGSDIDMSDCKLFTYQLNGDAQEMHGATHFCVIQLDVDKTVGDLYLQGNTIQGPAVLLLCNGESLVGFHCNKCAHSFVRWLLETQGYWKEKYHEVGSFEKAKTCTTIH